MKLVELIVNWQWKKCKMQTAYNVEELVLSRESALDTPRTVCQITR